MIIRIALLLLALPLTACAAKDKPLPPLTVVPELAQCPPPAKPPAALVQRPRKIDFFSTTP